MRSDSWDKKEKETDIWKSEKKEHTHILTDGKCTICGKTREQIRKEW